MARKGTSKADQSAEGLLALLRRFGGSTAPQTAIREFRFHPERKWRFDVAWPDIRLAIEVDGYGPGHYSIKGRDADNEKQNSALLLGWIVLRFSTSTIKRAPIGVVNVINEAIRLRKDGRL